MKIAIITNNKNSYPKPMAQGLGRMLKKLNIEHEIFYNGWSLIKKYRVSYKNALHLIKLRPVRAILHHFKQSIFLSKLNEFNLVIVVSHMPLAYLNDFINDKRYRKIVKKPLILYDLVYLKTRGVEWEKALRYGNDKLGIIERGNWGIERYDWHFSVSVVSEFPFFYDENCSIIGLDINDGTLFPDQEKKMALLDFPRNEFKEYRIIQKNVLKELNIDYVELNGTYTIDEIREIYRKASFFFISFRESFGLPVCELQACGALIFSPKSEWLPSHWLKEDLSKPGPGKFGSNFCIYESENDLKIILKERLVSFNAYRNRNNFCKEYPDYYEGNLSSLKKTILEITDSFNNYILSS